MLSVGVQAKHATEGCLSWGVNGENGEIVDMKDYGVWEAYSVKAQTYKTAIEVRLMQSISVCQFFRYHSQNWEGAVFSHLLIRFSCFRVS